MRDSTRDDEAKNKVTPKKGESEATKRDVAEAVQEANTVSSTCMPASFTG